MRQAVLAGGTDARTVNRGELQQGHRTVTFLEHGRGDPTITLLHPIGLDASWWIPHMELLADSHRTIAVDLAGHGGSNPTDPMRLESLAADVRAVWHETGTSSFAVLGVSMGGMVAQALAVTGAPLDGLILVSTAGALPDSARATIRERAAAASRNGMARLAAQTVERWFPPELQRVQAPLVEAARRQLAAANPDVHAAAWSMIADVDLLGGLGGVTCPALVVIGDADTSISVQTATKLAAAVPGARIDVVPGGSHMLAFENPAALVAKVTELLR